VKTSKTIQAKIHDATVKAMNDPQTHAAMIKLGAEPMATGAAEFAQTIKEDYKSFGEAIRVSGIQPN
jgi:tripartite-type tricarboxylate transporter receptor subunit TctC